MNDRLDRVIVAREMTPSRERAYALIKKGFVTVNGQMVSRPGEMVACDAQIVITGGVESYVGIGGGKLEAALKRFRLNVNDLRCLDVGASTGGFTDCLLQRGAEHVTAIDVGHGQMAKSLIDNPNIDLHEGVNARYITTEQFPNPFDLITVDVSFISLTLILPAVAPLLRPGGHILALVKPQFEVGHDKVNATGIVASPRLRQAAIEKIKQHVKNDLGMVVRDVIESPITGPKRNTEYFLCIRKPSQEAVAPLQA